MRLVRSCGVVLVAVLGLFGGGVVSVAAASAATDPAPQPQSFEHDAFLRFEGNSTWEYVQTNGYRYGQGSGTSVLDIVCDDGPCVLDWVAVSGPSFSGGQSRANLRIGAGDDSIRIPARGDPCGGSFELESRVDYSVSATSLNLTLDLVPAQFTCAANHYEYTGVHWVFDGVAVAGDACILDPAGCTEQGVDAVEPVGGVTTTPGTVGGRVSSTSRISAGAADAVSVLGALPTVTEAPLAPPQLLLAVAVTVVLVLLVALPTALLNSAVDAGAARVKEAWARRRRRRNRSEDHLAAEGRAGPDSGAREQRSGWWWAATGVLAAAFIASFVDPGFGFNVGSLRVFASIAVSFFVEIVVGWSVLVWLVRRANPEAHARYTFQPLTLLIVALAVMVTRLTGFEPGIVFGLVAGVTFGSALALAGRARATLVGSGFAFVLAIGAWFAYSAVSGAAGDEPGAAIRFVLDCLSSFTIGGVASLPIALMPLRGLSGHDVWRWSRPVWFLVYTIGMFAFFFVVMPMPFAWDEVALSLWAWLGAFTVYAVVALGLWLVLARPWRKRDGETPAAPPMPEEVSTLPAD